MDLVRCIRVLGREPAFDLPASGIDRILRIAEHIIPGPWPEVLGLELCTGAFGQCGGTNDHGSRERWLALSTEPNHAMARGR